MYILNAHKKVLGVIISFGMILARIALSILTQSFDRV